MLLMITSVDIILKTTSRHSKLIIIKFLLDEVMDFTFALNVLENN